jgi:hypothetical protein
VAGDGLGGRDGLLVTGNTERSRSGHARRESSVSRS